MPNDLDKLQGVWNISSFESDGRKMAAAAFKGSTIVIKETTFTSVGMGGTYEGTIALDQTKKPKDLRSCSITAGHAAGTRHRGIYKIDATKWTICLAAAGKTRPESFATRAGTGLMLETLKRGRSPRRQDEPPRSLAGSRAKRATIPDWPSHGSPGRPRLTPAGAATAIGRRMGDGRRRIQRRRDGRRTWSSGASASPAAT